MSDAAVLIEAAAFKLAFVAAAGAAWWGLMRLVRRSQSWPWAEVRGELKAGNVAVAVHAAGLAIALAIVMGLAVG